MNLIGVDVSLTGWSCKYLSEMVVNYSFFQATTILILVCTTIDFCPSLNLNLHYVNVNETHPRISSSLAFIAG